jgi:HAE1 family hydrophobic/amphiphilic exporter-1
MKVAKLAVFRPIAMSMVILFSLILGVVSARNMPVDLFPDLTFPVAAVMVTYDGASPEEVEKLLSSPIENVMGTIPNIESVSSVSRNGAALIIVSFTWGTDMDFASLQMREKIDSVSSNLPEEVSPPRVMRFNPSDLPIIQLALTTDRDDLTEAKKIVENEITPLLDSIEGVASVSIEGGLEKEIQIQTNSDTLNTYGLTLQRLKNILAAENLTIPSGSVEENKRSLPVRTTGELTTLSEIKKLKIPTNKGIVELENIAAIVETTSDPEKLSYLNGSPGVGISVLKQSGTNTVQVVQDIQDELENLDLPKGVEFKTIFDQARFINQSIESVFLNMVVGSLLAAGILYLFLRDFRSTLIIGFAIPISIITAFVFMYFSGQTLNLLTLGGLALGVGMMVDNSIVILENIYRQRQNGAGLKEAAVNGTQEVGSAIIASTLTTVVVFLPIVFVDGLAAQLFKPLALSVTFSLIASLLTALIVVPLLSSNLLYVRNEKSPFQERFNQMSRKYKSVLKWCLSHPKKIIFGTTALILASLAGIPFIGTEFLPAQDQSYLNISASLPPGSSIETTYEMTESINKRLESIDEIELSYVTIGGTTGFSIQAGSNTNEAMYSILLKPVGQRDRSDLVIADEIRKDLDKIPSADIEVSASDTGFSEDPISIEVTGPELNVLEDISNDIIEQLNTITGVREPRSNYETGNPQLEVSLNKTKASYYGVSTAAVAATINEATNGKLATTLSRNGEQLDVRLLLNSGASPSISELSNLMIKAANGTMVPLEAVADIERGTGPNQITRTDRLREMTITASLIGRDLGSTVDEIQDQLIQNISLPQDYTITFGGQNQQMNDAFIKLSGALALAIVLIYMVMAAQFESFFYPFIVMFTVPIIIVGIICGLLLTGQPFGVGSLVGVLILAGIVVNNAIVLIDYINLQKGKGAATLDAIMEAGPARLRPILMTAMTTILGLIPLSLGFGEGTEIQQPMAIVIIFGLSFATVITLILIPVIYYLFDKRRAIKKERIESH